MEPSDDVKQFEIVCVSYESPGEVRQDSIDRNGSRFDLHEHGARLEQE
jgi:hypothetical protein